MIVDKNNLPRARGRQLRRTSRTLLFGAIFSLLFQLATHGQGEGRRGPIDWIFLVDTSKSMVGKGRRAKNIFSKVKSTMNEFVDNNLVEGDSVDIFRFDVGVQFRINVPIVDRASREKLKREIESLTASGDFTHTGEAVRSVLDRSSELNRLTELTGTKRQTAIVLLTDGVEDIKPGSNARDLDSLQASQLEAKPYLFFVWLGYDKAEFKESGLNRLRRKLGKRRAFLLDHSRGEDVVKIVTEIRERILPPITVNPKRLDFGRVESDSSTEGRSLKVNSPRQTSIRLRLVQPRNDQVALASPKGAVDLHKGENTVEVKLNVASATADGTVTGSILVVLDEVVLDSETLLDVHLEPRADAPEIGFSLEVFHLSWLQKAARVSGKLLIALIILAAMILWICIRLSIGLADEVRKWQIRKHLAGRFVISHPGGKEEHDRLIDLSLFKAERRRLSDFSQLKDLLGDSDAELCIIGKGRTKRVQLSLLKGTVTVNRIPAAIEILEDDDVVQVGGALLTFSYSDK